MEELNNENTEQIPVANPDEVTFPSDPIDDEKKNRNGKKKNKDGNQHFGWSVILIILAIVVNLAFIFEMFYVTKYSTLATDVFVKLNIVAMVALLVIDFLVFLSVRIKNKILLGLVSVVLVASGALGAYAGYALTRVSANVTEITASEHTEEANASVVIYNLNVDPIMEVGDLAGKAVGVVTGTNSETIGKENFDALGINPEYVSYNSYADAFRGLVHGEVVGAFLPKNYQITLGTDADLANYLNDTAVLETYTSEVVTTGVEGADKDLTTEPFTVLITGENEGLADTIILASINPVSMNVTLTSIARDSYVPITCYNNSSSKINSAHAVSESCMVETVEQLTGVDIDYTVEFNFASVIQVVDAVGGLDVVNPVEFDAQCWDIESDSLVVITLPAGELHLTGQQALGWVRERYAFTDGDFARQQHQREAIIQIMEKIMATRDPNTYLAILDAAGSNIKTNLSETQMVNFLSYAMGKINRYYNSNNPIGVFNITSERITGYNGQLWNDSLEMYLYIYLLYDGALSDAYSQIENNTNLYRSVTEIPSVSWSASEAYEVPTAISDYYSEYTETVIGGSTESTDDYYEETPTDGNNGNTEDTYYDNSETPIETPPADNIPTDDNNAGDEQPGGEIPTDDNSGGSTDVPAEDTSGTEGGE